MGTREATASPDSLPAGSVGAVDRSRAQFEAWRTSFAGAVPAQDYDALRPSYPTEAVRWVLGEPAGPLDVLDLGAGTGLLTQLLVEAGHHVVAVDPSAPMRAALSRRLPDVDVREGRGEQVPVPDAAVDAVVLGQAWHWVEPVAGGAELARVLRPAGVVGLLWNTRDAGVGWVRSLYEVAGEPVRDRGDVGGTPHVPGPFGPVEARTVDNPHRLASATDVGRLAGTWSWVRTADDPATVMARVAEVAAGRAARDGSVTIPQVTEAYRLRRT